jgi:hypothetical protein
MVVAMHKAERVDADDGDGGTVVSLPADSNFGFWMTKAETIVDEMAKALRITTRADCCMFNNEFLSSRGEERYFQYEDN